MKSRKPTNKKSKNMTITYKNLEYQVVSERDNSFTGYAIVRDTGKISYITEVQKGEDIGKISFRPTNEPLIFSVQYNDGYTEQRYNTGSVSSVYHLYDNKLYGEFIRYDISGKLITRAFYENNTDVTPDIMSYISFSGSNEDFNTYVLSDDEAFNVTMRYGGHFKFHSELSRESTRFDEIVRNCIN